MGTHSPATMADESDHRANWIPVTVRLKMPAGTSRVEIFRAVEREDDLHAHLEFDRRQTPVLARLRDAEPEFLKSGGQYVVVRARVDPAHLAALRGAPYVDHVTREGGIEPFRSSGSLALGEHGRGAPLQLACGTSP